MTTPSDGDFYSPVVLLSSMTGISSDASYPVGYPTAEASKVEHRVAKVPERDTPEGMRQQSWLGCAEVLHNTATYQGRADVNRLAKALLATNTAASLERHNENKKDRS